MVLLLLLMNLLLFLSMQKENVLNYIKTKVQEKIENLQHLISEARNSNNDTKSSMGDKYETGREMLQQVINQYQSQLKEVLAQKEVLDHLTTDVCTKVQNGALVKTERALFYISVSLGEIQVEDSKVFAVSKEAPLVQAMFGKSISETFNFNGQVQTILSIW